MMAEPDLLGMRAELRRLALIAQASDQDIIHSVQQPQSLTLVRAFVSRQATQGEDSASTLTKLVRI